MATEKSPAFQLYVKEFLADANQAGMSLMETGAYARLMCFEWNEHGKGIPDDCVRCGRMVGATAGQMKRMWAALRSCFRPHPDTPGRLIHPRLQLEREKQAEFSRRQTNRADARWKKQKHAMALPRHPSGIHSASKAAMPEACSPISHLPSPISGKTEREPPLDEAWETFCQAYPQDRVERGRIVQDGFIAACLTDGVSGVMQRLMAHKRSAQWRKGMVPRMGNYFGEKQLWRQALPEQDTADLKPVDVTAMAAARIAVDEARYGKRR